MNKTPFTVYLTCTMVHVKERTLAVQYCKPQDEVSLAMV